MGLPGLDGPKAVCGGAEVSSSLSAYVISQRSPQNVTLDLVTEALPLSRPWHRSMLRSQVRSITVPFEVRIRELGGKSVAGVGVTLSTEGCGMAPVRMERGTSSKGL